MPPDPATPEGRFASLIRSLLAAIGAHTRTLPGWLCLLMHVRVSRLGQRVARIFERLRAGAYRAPPPRAPAPSGPAPSEPSPSEPSPSEPIPRAEPQRPRNPIPETIAPLVPAGARLPGGFGWMNRLLPFNHRIYFGAACAGALRRLLQDPEMQATLRAAPTLGRQLRPLCHMLGVALPDYLKLPPRPHRPQRRTPGPRPPPVRTQARPRARAIIPPTPSAPPPLPAAASLPPRGDLKNRA